MSAPDFFALAVRHVHGLPDNWNPCVYEVMDRRLGYTLTGAITTETYSRGPRKGSPKFPPRRDMQRYSITPGELDQAKDRWEHETGQCHKCGGTGQVIKSIGISGATYKDCNECSGTGKAAHLRGNYA